MSWIERIAATGIHWLLWNLTPPEFAHSAMIRVLRVHQALWLRPREWFRREWLALWLAVLAESERRLDERGEDPS